MSDQKPQSDRVVILKNVRISFPELLEATQYQGQGAFTYKAALLVDPGSENDVKIKKAISVAAREAWKDKAKEIMSSIKGNSNKFCYVDGNTKKYDGYQDKWALSASRQKKDGKPKLIDGKHKPIDANSDVQIYGGCYVDAKVEFWGQKNKWGNGMRCTLLVVMFRGHGDSFSGAAAADDSGMESIEDDLDTSVDAGDDSELM